MQDYRPFSLSSSRVGSYIPRSFNSIPATSPRNNTPVPGTPPTTPISPALGTRMGAHEEDLSSMSSIQSLVLRQQPPDKLQPDLELQQEQDMETTQEEPHAVPEDQGHEHEEHDQVDQPFPSLEQFSSLINPLANLYLPPLPNELLKAPRAGPPTSASTLDILVCISSEISLLKSQLNHQLQRTAIVYASPPAITETDVIYPLRPFRREIE